jgi:hypothetical protein
MGQYTSTLLSESEEAQDSNGIADVDNKVLVLGAGNFGCCLADHLACKSRFSSFLLTLMRLQLLEMMRWYGRETRRWWNR